MPLNIIFDLDETLIDTSRLKPYRATDEGRKYVAENPFEVDTRDYSLLIKKVVKSYHSRNAASIVTNAAPEYALSLLEKHGFPRDIPIYANAQKPSIESIKQSREHHNSSEQETLMVGDTAKDILTAHQARVASVAVTWGSTSTREQIEKAEPTKIISNPSSLEEIIANFEEGLFKYRSRRNHEGYKILPKEKRGITFDESPIHKCLGCFYNYKENKNDSYSNKIRAFNQSREISVEDIQRGSIREYFAGGKVRKGESFKEVLDYFKTGICSLIESFKIEGEIGIIAAPNSCPEYCYKTDSNQMIIEKIAEETGYKQGGDVSNNRRVISRIFPIAPSHFGGRRDLWMHHSTMGYSPIINLESIENIIIFDNIKTTGAQLESIASMLRYFDFKGEIYSVTLGDTFKDK